MPKTVGVLGGLGPAATVDFMARIIANTRANSDQEHLRMLIDHNPGVPNRHDAIAGRTPSVAPQLVDMAVGLERAGADFLVMVCNTAHAYTADIRAAVRIPFVSIVDVTVEALAPTGAGKVGVMAAAGCLQAGLYQQALARSGYEPLIWREDELDRFMAAVYQIKAGQRGQALQRTMLELGQRLVSRGAEALIAGCTEIPLILEAGQAPVPMLASTDTLVSRTIALAKGEL
jgi:aspartate racemase